MASNFIFAICGALGATAINLLFFKITELAKSRRELVVEVTKWLDEFYDRLQTMLIHKEKYFEENSKWLTDDECRLYSRKIKSDITSSLHGTLVQLCYGPGKEVALFTELQKNMQEVASLFWSTNQDNWQEKGRLIHEKFKMKIDPLRAGFSQYLIRSTEPKDKGDSPQLRDRLNKCLTDATRREG